MWQLWIWHVPWEEEFTSTKWPSNLIGQAYFGGLFSSTPTQADIALEFDLSKEEMKEVTCDDINNIF